jgi:hypothetical protein
MLIKEHLFNVFGCMHFPLSFQTFEKKRLGKNREYSEENSGS